MKWIGVAATFVGIVHVASADADVTLWGRSSSPVQTPQSNSVMASCASLFASVRDESITIALSIGPSGPVFLILLCWSLTQPIAAAGGQQGCGGELIDRHYKL